MSSLVYWVYQAQQYLSTTPVHPTYFPFAWLDVLGAIRLSIFVDQFSRQRNGVKPNELGAGKRDYVVSRTPVHRFIPRKPSVWLELPLSLFDALGRAIILTSFSVDFIRHTTTLPLHIRTNPWLMVLAAFINTVPFASLAFACHMFDKDWSFSTPGELQPEGWKMVDFWAPPVIATLYATLVRAHPVFDVPYQTLRLALMRRPSVIRVVGFDTFKEMFPLLPMPRDPLEARAICAIVLTCLFRSSSVVQLGRGT
ncbi:hypothetical protein QFC20_000893 [Naganishia adeliensis]|uniref:Uncharacterized protein n=1 Tax=Naganishia adeliensis TaxID=92952 RepID=A0ACC2WUU2_9TREE|nr:hypothetical protein QFC20_000893 [Naganishia adeliensis]